MTTAITLTCIAVAIIAGLCAWGLKSMIQEYHKDDEEWNRELDKIIEEGIADIKKERK